MNQKSALCICKDGRRVRTGNLFETRNQSLYNYRSSSCRYGYHGEARRLTRRQASVHCSRGGTFRRYEDPCGTSWGQTSQAQKVMFFLTMTHLKIIYPCHKERYTRYCSPRSQHCMNLYSSDTQRMCFLTSWKTQRTTRCTLSGTLFCHLSW